MLTAVVLNPARTVVFLESEGEAAFDALEPAPPEWEVRHDVALEPVPASPLPWPEGHDRPGPPVLGSSVDDDRRYRVFLDGREVDPALYRETGWDFAGIYELREGLWTKLREHHRESMTRMDEWIEPEDNLVALPTAELGRRA